MIYCVEDDDSVREIEVYTLESTGFEAWGFSDGKSFFEALDEQLPKLVILDIMLPNEDGIEILKKIRQNPDTKKVPVIMATAKGMEFDKVQALDKGADDYLVKPFGMMEMVSRVRAVLRRCGEVESTSFTLSIGTIVLDPREFSVTVEGVPVELTLKEFELLQTLMKSPKIVFTRSRLLDEIWNYDYSGETRTVDMHIKTLRQKLGDAGELIETVRGVGYRLGVDR
ncbi:MAG: response regulator transcription factor [Tissierellia bacterium]|nr:response regulator transcription factor [Tissierellia bacterium]